MKISVCITVYNEERTISSLLESLLNQSKNPNEIVIVDGGSTDQTVEIIRHYQKKTGKLIKLIVEKCTRAKGRNLSVELSQNEIIAVTDADCIARKNWLKSITEPLKIDEVGIVAGFYNMMGETPFLKAEKMFLGVLPDNFNNKFLPSTRSIAFKKSVWDMIGGFPERRDNSAEDTDFNYKATTLGVKYARVKDARVEWTIPNNYRDFVKKIYSYALWDGKYGHWWHPMKGLSSHNIKAILKVMRIFFGILLFITGIFDPAVLILILILVVLYTLWSFRKVFNEFRDWKAGIWGIILQFTSDFVVAYGFIKGVLQGRRI